MKFVETFSLVHNTAVDDEMSFNKIKFLEDPWSTYDESVAL